MRRAACGLAGSIAVAFALGSGVVACGGGDATPPLDGGAPDARPIDVGDGSVPVPGIDASVDAPDATPPARIDDLAATPASITSITLAWTAPDAPGGRAAVYDLRYAKTPITTEAEFLAATNATAPSPAAAGAKETAEIKDLEPGTEYHFAIRARGATGAYSEISNDASAKTKPRAKLLITEVGATNGVDEGFDFVELVATEAGSAEGIEIRERTTMLHTMAAIELAEGDRVVVHLSDLPGPAGFAQEDEAKDMAASTAAFASVNAYDVYSDDSGLTATDNIIVVVDGAKTIDALAFADRGATVASATMKAFADAKADGSWTFTVTPQDDVNDCETERDAVNMSTERDETACGAFETILDKAVSLNRDALEDTNTKADFYLAAQTPGEPNAAVPAPNVIAGRATSATTAELVFDQEIAPVAAASFTIDGLNVTAATADVNHVTLTTDAQAEQAYDVTVGGAVTNLQGVAVAGTAARFCGYSAMGAALTLTELNPNITGSTDLVELVVTRGGALLDFSVRSNPTAAASGTLVADLPAICAKTGDVVVLHVNPADDPATSETLAKDEQPQATYAQNYDGAWDVRGGSSGLTATQSVIAIRNPAGDYVEAVAFSKGGATSGAFRDSLAFVQAEGLWTPPDCGGEACDDDSTPTAQAISASTDGVGSTAGGASCRRTAPAAAAASWAVGASSFGSAN